MISKEFDAELTIGLAKKAIKEEFTITVEIKPCAELIEKIVAFVLNSKKHREDRQLTNSIKNTFGKSLLRRLGYGSLEAEFDTLYNDFINRLFKVLKEGGA